MIYINICQKELMGENHLIDSYQLIFLYLKITLPFLTYTVLEDFLCEAFKKVHYYGV